MKKVYRFTILSVIALLFCFSGITQKSLPSAATYQQRLQSSALLFMENKGQVADKKGNPQSDILFTANSGGANIYLTATGIHYQFSKTDYPEGYTISRKHLETDTRQQKELQKQIKTSTHHFSVELQRANLQPTISKQGQSAYTENYYLAQYPNGITGVHGYEKITFKNVYPNVDWVVYSKGGFIEYDFLVHPGGDPASIKLKIKNADAISITPEGELLMKTSLGEVKEKAPLSYSDGYKVSSRFKQNSDGTIGFAVQSQPDKELRIDPSVIWSTYYGGSDIDDEYATTTDDSSNVYMAGYTSSTSNIAAGGHQNTYTIGPEAFVVKFDSAGNRIWGTYYGGNSNTKGYGCAVENGFLYLCGETNSSIGIAQNGFQNTNGGNLDAFIVKFNLNGVRVWGSYYGGFESDAAYSCTVDNNNNVFLAGYTSASAGIASGGYQNTYSGGRDAFLVKFDAAGNRLWGTYFGGTASDWVYSCTTDAANNIFIAGQTNSATSIASGGYQNSLGGGQDAFLAKMNPAGNLLWATYLGGTGADGANGCITDKYNNVYLAGNTESASGIAFSGFQNTFSGYKDAFLAKFSTTGSMLWSTYYGASGEDYGNACVPDDFGNVFLAGLTSSSTSIATNGFQNTYGGSYDAFVAKFSSGGSRLWGSYYGGTGGQYAWSVSCDKAGYLYLGGTVSVTLGLSANGFQTTYGGGALDAFLTRIQIGKNPLTLCPGGSGVLPALVTGTTYQWQVDAGTGYTNIADGAAYNGTTSSTLLLNAAPSTWYGYAFRCLVDGNPTEPYQLKFENSWRGTASNLWTNPANWSCGQLPDGNTDVIINSGPVVLNSNGICRTITVRPGVSFTVTTGNTLTITH